MEPTSAPLVWITGAGGLIGHYLLRTAPTWVPQYRIHGSLRPDLDLCDSRAVKEFFEWLGPAAIIHCAAMTKPEACQQEPALARRINVEATALLADLARDIPFLFFSTDLVFDGTARWYDETHPPRPLNLYGLTKVEAERYVLANPRHSVIRTSLTAGISPSGHRAFNEEMRDAWRNGRTLRLFTDEFRCPIPATATARAVWELLQLDRPGLYHLAGRARLSRWQIGELLARRHRHLAPKLEPGSRLDYAGPPRAADTSLDCTKIQRLLSFRLPSFSDWLTEAASDEF